MFKRRIENNNKKPENSFNLRSNTKKKKIVTSLCVPTNQIYLLVHLTHLFSEVGMFDLTIVHDYHNRQQIYRLTKNNPNLYYYIMVRYILCNILKSRVGYILYIDILHIIMNIV